MSEGRRERRRLEMRERLLTSALALFAEQGVEATTIDQIAAHADVARQTVLNHYPTKKDFVRAWGQRRRDDVDQVIGPTDGGLRPQLHRFYRALAEINERERALTRTIHADQQALNPERPIPEALLRALEDSGEVAPDPGVRPVAEILTAVYFDTLARWLVPEPPPFGLADELVARVDVVLLGVAQRPVSTSRIAAWTDGRAISRSGE